MNLLCYFSKVSWDDQESSESECELVTCALLYCVVCLFSDLRSLFKKSKIPKGLYFYADIPTFAVLPTALSLNSLGCVRVPFTLYHDIIVYS